MAEMLTSYWNLVPVTLVQSLLYAFIAFGIMIPFRMLNLPDLTCEGSFPLGGCTAAALIAVGLNPYAGTALAIGAGFLAGVTTAWLHLRFRIHTLLAGILVFSMLWSVNLRTMGKPNIPVPPGANVFDLAAPALLGSNAAQIALFAIVVGLTTVVLVWLFRTEIGLSMRCVGANPALAPALGINSSRYVLFGFGLANAVVAAGGALLVQQQGYADVTLGFGVLINGLAALIIGEALIGNHNVARQVLAPVAGSIIYYQLLSLGLASGLNPSDLKFLTGLFVIFTLALPALRRHGRTAT